MTKIVFLLMLGVTVGRPANETAVGISNSVKVSFPCFGYVINGMCYRFFSVPKIYTDAEFYCNNNLPGGHLAAVTSASLHEQLADLVLNAYGGPVRTWVGGFNFFKTGQYKWTDGSSWKYTGWKVGEPNNSGGKEDCLEIFLVDKMWNDQTCADSKPFICSYLYTA
ncbi:lectin-like [Acipenser ruthenus]|uniref:lectin-like n=1 Tax=Acipenser ruthenus TaxID=7906 RepID=UPI0015616B35|nr:lectin-like [Acipenser ruthenus]